MWTAPAALVAALLGGISATDTVPLFASDEPLVLTLVADFAAIRRDRDEDPRERPALLLLPGGDTLEADLRPRGHFRRDPVFCSFPPLRVDVEQGSAEATAFQGQDKLKLVVPCRPDWDAYEGYVLREALLYRVYGLLTDVAFQVRLARITFVDTAREMEPLTRFAFFIESEEALARRVGGQLLDIPEGKILRGDLLHPGASTRVAIFQFMIGNTDWADARVHNVTLLGRDGNVIPVPYDFDLSGVVDAEYARPARELPIATVRQRLYMGWCWPDLDEQEGLRPFLDARPRIEALVGDYAHLDPGARTDVLEFLSGFFEAVATPERGRQRMFRDCQDPPS